MTQSLTDLLGANVTITGNTITIDLTDFTDSNGTQILDDPSSASDSQKIATLISGIHQNTKPQTDANGIALVDKTNAIVSSESFSPKTFEVREDEAQIRHEFNFSIYTIDSTAFDPDNAI